MVIQLSNTPLMYSKYCLEQSEACGLQAIEYINAGDAVMAEWFAKLSAQLAHNALGRE